jgi:hypothetical protein
MSLKQWIHSFVCGTSGVWNDAMELEGSNGNANLPNVVDTITLRSVYQPSER